MKEACMNLHQIKRFLKHMREEERSKATIEKYHRDILKLYMYLEEDKTITKQRLTSYKESLLQDYKPSSINSMLEAVNQFFKFLKWYDFCIKKLKVQKRSFLAEEKELSKQEYEQLLTAAKEKQNERLFLLMQTICSTGIRVSELKFITREALHKGKAQIYNKGKIRDVYFSSKLRGQLLQYCRMKAIDCGPVFITRNGKAMNRSNIWSAMKALCKDAGVDHHKVYPHNLRHLFACTYYQMEKDLTRLADILGHSSIETTRIYTLTSGKECRKQYDAMGLCTIAYHLQL